MATANKRRRQARGGAAGDYDGFSPRQRRTLAALSTPAKIQDFVDGLGYNLDGVETGYSPRQVLELGKANCLEGAVFGACALRFNGLAPLLVDLRSVRDEDHAICVFQTKTGLWGSIAKSKFVWLGCREPVYASLRELVMSYFEHFYNYAGERTLKEYSDPIDLRDFDKENWMAGDGAIEFLHDALNDAKHHKLVDPGLKHRRVKGLRFHSNLLTDPNHSILLKK